MLPALSCAGLCKFGASWADKATNTNTAHGNGTWSECSRAGTCDRSSGQCSCFPGFTGDACHRSECFETELRKLALLRFGSHTHAAFLAQQHVPVDALIKVYVSPCRLLVGTTGRLCMQQVTAAVQAKARCTQAGMPPEPTFVFVTGAHLDLTAPRKPALVLLIPCRAAQWTERCPFLLVLLHMTSAQRAWHIHLASE